MKNQGLPKQYQYSGGYIGLPYDMHRIAPTLEIDGETLERKTEFHMSIFCVKKYAPILAEELGASVEQAEKTILDNASKILEKHAVSIDRFRGELRLAEERDKKTVVIMCNANNLGGFFSHMRDALSMDFPDQPTHVTLYKRRGGMGIGLPDPEEVSKITRLLNEEEMRIVKNAIGFSELPNQA